VSTSLFVSAVLLAAGRSARMGGDLPKVLHLLGERTVLALAARALLAAPSVRELVVVVPGEKDELGQLAERMRAELAPFAARVRALVVGGEERTDSVRRGVDASSPESDVILVHDAARPLVRPLRVEEVARAAADRGAAVLATPVRDTIKTSRDGRQTSGTLDRSLLWAAQTPQAFDASRLRRALRRAERDHFRPTDDAALFERYEGAVTLVEGDADNIKLTTPEDLAIGRALIAARAAEGSA